MYRSLTLDDGTEYDLIREDEHIYKVWKTIESNYEKYFTSFIHQLAEGDISQLSSIFSVKKGAANKIDQVQKFIDSIAEYEKQRQPYLKFFNDEMLEEYLEDDPKAFKHALKKECPIIRHLVNSKREELQKWKERFAGATSDELFSISQNLITFAHRYKKEHTSKSFGAIDRWKYFETEELQEEEDFRVEGVIGMGIKSIILYFLEPSLFPICSRRALYALYFLSEQKDFNLPSRSSEFLMINDLNDYEDHNFKMEHNYFYPYPLFTLFALRTYRFLEKRSKEIGTILDPKYRFVYVNAYYEHICEQHSEDIDTMLASEEYDL